MVTVFQIHYDEKTNGFSEPGFLPYSNLGRGDDYFENSVIRRVHEMNPAFKQGITYLGVTSWKQNQKTHLKSTEIINHIQKAIDAGSAKDVYLYTPVQGIEPEYDFSVDPPIHKAIIRQPDIWNQHRLSTRSQQVYKDDCLLNDSGVLPFDLFDGKWTYCHCNYWIARVDIFDEYCKKVLIPAIEFFNLPETKAKMPLWYKHPGSGKMYSSACFVLEGLFGSFLAHSNYSYEYICRKHVGRQLMPVRIDGYEIA